MLALRYTVRGVPILHEALEDGLGSPVETRPPGTIFFLFCDVAGVKLDFSELDNLCDAAGLPVVEG